eukprot:2744524-Alexandrium_andersonii.AAC.1
MCIRDRPTTQLGHGCGSAGDDAPILPLDRHLRRFGAPHPLMGPSDSLHAPFPAPKALARVGLDEFLEVDCRPVTSQAHNLGSSLVSGLGPSTCSARLNRPSEGGSPAAAL